MASITTPTSGHRSHAGAHDKGAWAERLGTAGWAAKGIIYLLIAFIAAQLALRGDTGGEEASKQGALRQLAEQPFGKAMLIVLAVGLAAYSAYRLLAIFLPQTGDDNVAYVSVWESIGGPICRVRKLKITAACGTPPRSARCD